MKDKIHHISKLRKALIQHLNWGPVEHWSTRNFDELSEKVFNQTQVQLSVSTLKRFLGKVNYDSLPSSATLDALSVYLGYQNFSGFLSQRSRLSGVGNRFVKKHLILTGLFSLVGFSAVLILSFTDLSNTKVDASSVSFAIEKVTTGIPNTVIFNYDVSRVDAKTVEIQQDWDPTKRHRVDPAKRIYTHFYEYPGYFNAKLLVNGEVVLTRDLFIPSDGWLATISSANEREKPYYLQQNELKIGDDVSISDSLLSALKNDKNERVLDFYNAFADPEMDFKNFDFRTGIRFSSVSGNYPCEMRRIIILGTGNSLRISMSVPGCAAKNVLRLGSEFVSGKDHDLSKFVAESGEWMEVRMINEENYLTVFIDDKIAFETLLGDDFGKLAGVRFSFNGVGEFKDLNLASLGKVLLTQ